MKNLPSIFVCATLLICCAVSTPAQVSFKPAEVTFATDVQSPSGSGARGIVVIDASLDAKGNVTGTEVLRDIASLSSTATSAVRAWKYRPAMANGTPRESRVRVAFVFRPHSIMASPPSFAPLQQQDGTTADAESGYIPPGIIAVAYPAYPIDAASVGAVVVRVGVDAGGKIGDVKVIRAFNPFTRFALEATRKWKIQAATFQGEPVASNITIAFVYSNPAY
jgi:TonB family protein